MWKFIALVSLSLAAIRVHAEPELKGSPAELSAYLASVPKAVSIAGEAEVKVSADRALISLNVVTENKSLQEASRANQELRARMLKTLAEHGLPADRVKASKFSSTPKYGVFKEKARSYRVENTIKITAHDEKEFQAVAGLVDSISEVRYESVEFEYSEKNELKAKARAQALDKLNDKKKFYEEKLGVKLSPKSFSEAVGTPTRPIGVVLRALQSKSSLSVPALTGLPDAADAFLSEEEVPSSFSELVYAARVTVEYAVEGK